MDATARSLLSCLLALALGFITCEQSLGAHDIPRIDTPALKTMMAQDDDIFLINVLPKIIHDAKHIPGSINIPLGQLSHSDALPEDRNAPLVFYCMGFL